ncbi:hypothetical protein ENKNEFLB_00484 [Nocardioides aquaticus]|uniref:Uncharacterized protein n=1 Tax=Nocardioides aquaticus TaxID=160826 RepID=A0ABX8ECE2_9ACTN|nr:hypothetical protein [Nocardioides aquaticus]QVT78111.1 hypothetical protein ENKNEFLB_00484 [Nocardioides aquaticus]
MADHPDPLPEALVIATTPVPPAQPARPATVKTVTHLEPAVPRRRPGRSVTSLSTRRTLRTAPAPFRIGSIEVAGHDEERCEHRSGSLRCVRGPHLGAPQAHVLVAGAPDPHHVAPPVRERSTICC